MLVLSDENWRTGEKVQVSTVSTFADIRSFCTVAQWKSACADNTLKKILTDCADFRMEAGIQCSPLRQKNGAKLTKRVKIQRLIYFHYSSSYSGIQDLKQ